MMRLILISLAPLLLLVPLLLAGCATAQPKIQIQRVNVPVPVACIDRASIPPEPAKVTLPDDARDAADVAIAQAMTLRGWGHELMALINPCIRGDAQ